MNRLNKEKSLYLLQHASNPVDWYPWCDEAFEMATKNHMPVLLSIGYSACHWCHVMAHESFENNEIAEIMNKNFINIKLDKEERPDLDKIYQISQTIITGKTGGWPLTIFMSPEKFPFFAGTYFPIEAKFGLPGFKDVLLRVTDFYNNQKEEIKNQNKSILEIFNKINVQDKSENILNKELVEKAVSELHLTFDGINGGFGSAPKFPQVYALKFLLKCKSEYREKNLDICEFTLKRMCLTGIYDLIDGGFFRYSVDELWMIPHFEKMLYDNGPMISILSDIYIRTKNTLFLNRAKDTSNWILSNMTDEEGGFYSTIDADSENSEGKYYVWEENELSKIMNDNDLNLIKNIFTIKYQPNFEGKYHLHVTKDKEKEYKKEIKNITRINKLLLTERNKRISPNIDKKILVSWNALVISGLIDIYNITYDPKYYNSAIKCFNFIEKKMYKNKKLFACYNQGAKFDAYLDDYVFLAQAGIKILKTKWDARIFKFVLELSNIIIENFEDTKNGGFYFTSKNHEKLFYRPKNYMDESLPSGNSIAIEVLLELGCLTGSKKFIDAAERTIKSASHSLKRNLVSHCSMLDAAKTFINEKEIIIIRCQSNNIKKYTKKLSSMNLDDTDLYLIPIDPSNTTDYFSGKKLIGDFTAYVCQGFKCLEPITDINELISKLP
tara:strand:+ start:102 stop:2102 length:2001 start_codon:yes stop_codon:yes gene_type:complete